MVIRGKKAKSNIGTMKYSFALRAVSKNMSQWSALWLQLDEQLLCSDTGRLCCWTHAACSAPSGGVTQPTAGYPVQNKTI